MKKLGVIILNWNGKKLLEKFLPSIAANTICDLADLIVADNGSDDGSLEWVRHNCKGVITLQFDRNYGFAEGYNRAIEACDYPYVVLLNSDVETTDGWWQPLLKILEENHDIGAIQPKILAYNNNKYFEYAGAAGGYLDKNGYPFCRGRLFDKVEEDSGQYDDGLSNITWASGACLMTKRDLYLKLGGLDPLFFAHMEEIDYCCRILNNGLRICATSESKVYHIGGASLNQGNPKKTYLNFRNNLLLLHKNLPEKIGRRKLVIRRLYDSLAFIMFVLKMDFANAKAILSAHKDFKTMRKNYTVYPEKDILCKQPGANHNIVIEHYLLGNNIIKI